MTHRDKHIDTAHTDLVLTGMMHEANRLERQTHPEPTSWLQGLENRVKFASKRDREPAVA